MTLKLSDLKGRTDLVGRKALIKEKRSFGVIREIKDNTLLFDTIAENYLWELKFSEPLTIELLDEEPLKNQIYAPNDSHEWNKEFADWNKERNAKLNEQTAKDTRTEITWENATMDDLIEFSPWADSSKKSRVPLRQYLIGETLDVRFVQPNDPIGMTHSQIEEKLGHKVEIVDV